MLGSRKEGGRTGAGRAAGRQQAAPLGQQAAPDLPLRGDSQAASLHAEDVHAAAAGALAQCEAGWVEACAGSEPGEMGKQSHDVVV